MVTRTPKTSTLIEANYDYFNDGVLVTVVRTGSLTILSLGYFLVAMMVAPASANDPAVRLRKDAPNVVIVITDDQGYGDLSCHGNPVLKTPSLDTLHAESVRLTDYHVSPTCAPTRASLQSGHWANRTGVWHTIMGRSMLRAGEPTIGEVFSKAGYATGMFGKWHLGDNYPFRPEDRGYTHVLRHGGGGVGQTPDYWNNAYFDDTYFLNGEPTKFKGFCTDVFFENAKQFITERTEANQPFVAYISTNAPHGPLHAPVESAKKYADQGSKVANFFGMIDNIDTNVGQLRAFLAEKNIAENTIFIFTTDNGTANGRKIFNAGMQGKKGSQYDGGHRVPFFIHWPAGKLNRPTDVKPITHAVDVLPTLIDLCKLKPDADTTFDGKSVASLLQGKPDPEIDWNNRVMFTDSQRVKDPIMWKSSSVMTSRWRLIDGEKLFDMDVDPAQKQDVAAAYPAEVRELRAHYQTWWEEIQPSFSDATAIIVGNPAENPAKLTCHDWVCEAHPPWNQQAVRAAKTTEKGTGFWNIDVSKAGKYRIELYRWPKEANARLNDSLPPGTRVPGHRAFRMTPGRGFQFSSASLSVANLELTTVFDSNVKAAVFETELPAGRTQLKALLQTSDGNKVGAFYVYVQLLESAAE